MNTLPHLPTIASSSTNLPSTISVTKGPFRSTAPSAPCEQNHCNDTSSAVTQETSPSSNNGASDNAERDQFLHYKLKDIFARWPKYQQCLVEQCGLLPDDLNGLVKVSREVFVWRLIPRAASANAHNSVHGGFATYIADTLSTFHLSVYSGRPTHVSANIHMAFHNAIPVEGEPVLLTTQVVKVGKRLAYLHASFALETNPLEVLATMQQTKAFLPDQTKLSVVAAASGPNVAKL